MSAACAGLARVRSAARARARVGMVAGSHHRCSLSPSWRPSTPPTRSIIARRGVRRRGSGPSRVVVRAVDTRDVRGGEIAGHGRAGLEQVRVLVGVGQDAADSRGRAGELAGDVALEVIRRPDAHRRGVRLRRSGSEGDGPASRTATSNAWGHASSWAARGSGYLCDAITSMVRPGVPGRARPGSCCQVGCGSVTGPSGQAAPVRRMRRGGAALNIGRAVLACDDNQVGASL